MQLKIVLLNSYNFFTSNNLFSRKTVQYKVANKLIYNEIITTSHSTVWLKFFLWLECYYSFSKALLYIIHIQLYF